MNAVSGIIFIYVGIFVNLYIWEQGQNIFDVSWFNLVLFFSWGLAYAGGSALLSRFSIRTLMALSAAFGAAAFALLSSLEIDNRLLWIAIVGMPVGAMQGLFSAAQNISVTLLGQGKDFGPYFAAANIVTQLLNMTVPLLSAQVIRFFGYGSSFVLMLAFIALMLVFAAKLPQITLKDDMPADHAWFRQLSLKTIFGGEPAKWFFVSCLATGFILQFQGLFALLFTFSVTENKTYVALLNTCYTLFALLAMYAYRKWDVKERFWIVASIVLLGGGLMLMLVPVPVLRIVSNVVTTVGMFYFTTILTAQQLRMTTTFTVARRANMLVWREWMFCVSRIAMLLVALTIDSFRDPVFYALAVFVAVILIAITFIQGKMMGKPM